MEFYFLKIMISISNVFSSLASGLLLENLLSGKEDERVTSSEPTSNVKTANGKKVVKIAQMVGNTVSILSGFFLIVLMSRGILSLIGTFSKSASNSKKQSPLGPLNRNQASPKDQEPLSSLTPKSPQENFNSSAQAHFTSGATGEKIKEDAKSLDNYDLREEMNLNLENSEFAIYVYNCFSLIEEALEKGQVCTTVGGRGVDPNLLVKGFEACEQNNSATYGNLNSESKIEKIYDNVKRSNGLAVEYRASTGNKAVKIFVYRDENSTKRGADVMVNAANAQMGGGGGICGAIHNLYNFDNDIKIQQEKVFGSKGRVNLLPGEVFTTKCEMKKNPKFHCPYLMQVLGPDARNLGANDSLNLIFAYWNLFRELDRLGAKSVIIPNISTNIFGYSKEKGAAIACTVLRMHLEKHPETSIETVWFAQYDTASVGYYEYFFKRVFDFGKESV